MASTDLAVAPLIEQSPNPWNDAPPDSDENVEVHPSGSQPEAAPLSKDFLKEFDPLEEEVAREAWKNSDGHPPPPRTPSPPPPAPQIKELLVSPTSPSPPDSGSLSSSSFPSLASLARNLALPSLSRPRPLSLDGARPVPSPATLSSLAAQQEPSTGQEPSTSASHSASDTSSPTSNSRQNLDIPFDFQHFLDQMKSRSADPVSKYLRSYVSTLHSTLSSGSPPHARFLSNFAKRTFTVSDQVKIINDFLTVRLTFHPICFGYPTLHPSSSRRRCAYVKCGRMRQMRNSTTQWRVWRSWL